MLSVIFVYVFTGSQVPNRMKAVQCSCTVPATFAFTFALMAATTTAGVEARRHHLALSCCIDADFGSMLADVRQEKHCHSLGLPSIGKAGESLIHQTVVEVV